MTSDIMDVNRRNEMFRGEVEQLMERCAEGLLAAQTDLLRQERLATLKQLTASVSHELRNPLGGLCQIKQAGHGRLAAAKALKRRVDAIQRAR